MSSIPKYRAFIFQRTHLERFHGLGTWVSRLPWHWCSHHTFHTSQRWDRAKTFTSAEKIHSISPWAYSTSIYIFHSFAHFSFIYLVHLLVIQWLLMEFLLHIYHTYDNRDSWGCVYFCKMCRSWNMYKWKKVRSGLRWIKWRQKQGSPSTLFWRGAKTIWCMSINCMKNVWWNTIYQKMTTLTSHIHIEHLHKKDTVLVYSMIWGPMIYTQKELIQGE